MNKRRFFITGLLLIVAMSFVFANGTEESTTPATGADGQGSVLVGDLPVLHGDVEVAAHEHLFAFKILEVFYRHFVHKNISP